MLMEDPYFCLFTRLCLCGSEDIVKFVGTVVPATAGPLGERPPALAGHFCDVPTTLPC